MKINYLIAENKKLRQALAKSEQVNSSFREQATLLQEQLAKFQTSKHSLAILDFFEKSLI